jgi:hypothetical protein
MKVTIIDSKTGKKCSLYGKTGQSILKKYINQKGGVLSTEDETAFVKSLKSNYPYNVAEEIGRLIARQGDINTIEQARLAWDQNLENSGYSVDPMIGKNYMDDEFTANEIEKTTDEDELKPLVASPPHSTFAEYDYTNACAFGNNPNYLIQYYGNKLSQYEKIIAQKWMDHCDWDPTTLPTGCDDAFSQIMLEKNLYFKHYIKGLPEISEGNEALYELALELTQYTTSDGEISFKKLFPAKVIMAIKDSLTWSLIKYKPCVGIQKGSNVEPLFCYDPFYINETIGWSKGKASGKQVYIRSDKWFKNRDISSKITKLRNKYFPEIATRKGVNSNIPDTWWEKEFLDLLNKSIVNASSSQREQLIAEKIIESGNNIAPAILLMESIVFKEQFLYIQQSITILKYLLNIAIILGHTSGNSTITEEINIACPETKQYFLTSSEIQSGCAASMGRELKYKLKRLQDYINSSFTKMPKTDKQLSLINSMGPRLTNDIAIEIIGQFGQILKGKDPLLRDTILNKAMEFSIIYEEMNSPVCLMSDQAEALGLTGSDLEIMNAVYLSSMA